MAGQTKVSESPAHVHVVHRIHDRFDILIGPSYVSVDQPVSAGGDGTAPTPTDLFVASWAACGAFYAQRFLRRHEIDGHVSVGCRWSMARKPARVGSINMRFEVPDIPIELRKRLLDVIEHCTVHNSILNPPEVSIELDPGAGALAS